ncbi:MAG: DUF4038 domain-containing protein, partial [Bacillota bacterium]|nr:DUF4038 domain-containing protein [Bacillota bacterium]
VGCSAASDRLTGCCSGLLEILPYSGDNPLYRHGAIGPAPNRRYLQHADGTPFFWLADTWWMGLTTRLAWPAGFMQLTADRKTKGFNVVQIVAGLYPDMEPFDPRGANEAGFPWTTDWQQINPDYFDAADLKIAWLVEQGIVPCIVGSWGYLKDYAGIGTIRRHWNNLIARWGAYPVVWCLAGEATMPYYNNPDIQAGRLTREQYAVAARKDWTVLMRHVREKDPFHRLVTIHPTANGHEQVEDESLLDLDMLQTGHGSFLSLAPTVRQVRTAVARNRHPVINSEVCYEGICASSGADVQRYAFWSCVLSGCCGHTYGANGIWQLNAVNEPYGLSPHGASWGDTSWQDASQLPGSGQLGLGRRLLMRYPWWQFEPHPEWTEKSCSGDSLDGFFAAGVPGVVRLIFKPFLGGTFRGEDKICALEPDVSYRAFYFNPINGSQRDLGLVEPDSQGCWLSPRFSAFQDWVLVLEAVAPFRQAAQ